MVLFGFQFNPVCNLGKFINFGLGTVRSERVILEYFGLVAWLASINLTQVSSLEHCFVVFALKYS